METQKITVEFVREALPPRRADGHKGDFGKVLIAGGAVGYTGAPYLAALGAARSGCGLVYLGVPSCIWTVTAAKCVCAMPFPLPEEGGMQTQALTLALLKTEKPVVLDADGINALAGHMDSLDARRERITVLTPHDGEFARLGGDLTADRAEESQRFAMEHGCYLVRKGHGTLIATPSGTVLENPTGNSGLAKGGSGDVLTGVIAALLAQGATPVRAAACGAYLHGLAGDLCAGWLTEYGMTPQDAAEALPHAFQSVLAEE